MSNGKSDGKSDVEFASRMAAATKYEKGELLYEGKAKKIFSVLHHTELIWQEFKDSLTAFNAQKIGSFAGKGHVNKEITTLIFRYLAKCRVASHWVADLSATEMITQKLNMVKAEVVVRNILAGSTAKKFGLQEGVVLDYPLVEFYYKDDALADPFMSDDQAVMMKVATHAQLKEMKDLALEINHGLKEFFLEANIDLVDFKIELGRDRSGVLFLADEITPDTCRLWDRATGDKLDKDRFRRDLGFVEQRYNEVLDRVKLVWGSRL